MTPRYEGSSLACTSEGNPCPGGYSPEQTDDHLQEKVYEQSPSRVSTGSSSFSASSSALTKDDEGGDISDGGGAFRWMPSKMRIMRKMMNSGEINDPHQWIGDNKDNNDNQGVPTGTVRVCSDCNTTKTPLWRSGPRGPKSLCNACGIRQRKARRAMMAAGLIPAAEQTKAKKEKIAQSESTVPFKKRCKFNSAPTRKKLRFEEFAMSIRSSSAFHGVFPQDEKDAAVLLMGLSCGLIHS